MGHWRAPDPYIWARGGTMLVMLLVSFLSWWYGAGWRQVLDSFGPRLQAASDNFSVRQLSRTMFAPWRRIITDSGDNLDTKWRAFVDNTISRIIGFCVRVIVVLTALLVLAGIFVFTAAELVVWPLLPLAIPGFLIKGLLG